MGNKKRRGKIGARLMTVIMALGLLAIPSENVYALEKPTTTRTVKVGFYSLPSYNEVNKEGELSGYRQDFLRMIAPYSNLEYEYVGEGKSWTQLQNMMANGEIDLLSMAPVAYGKDERFEYSDLSIGSFSNILLAKSTNDSIPYGDTKALEGKKIGIKKGTSQREQLEDYEKEHGFSSIKVEYDNQENMCSDLQSGKIDLIFEVGIINYGSEYKVVNKFGSTKFYVITKKGDQDLISRINYGMSKLEESYPSWNEELVIKYFSNSGGKVELSPEEKAYLEELNDKPLRVLINPDREPYSYVKEGKAGGIFYDLLELASKNYGFKFEIIPVKSTEEYDQAMTNGQADIVFDCPSSSALAAEKGYNTTTSYYEGTLAILHRKDVTEFKRVAAKNGAVSINPLYKTIYGNKEIINCESLDECVQGVRLGEADCCYMYVYTAANYVTNDERASLAYAPVTGAYTSFCIAVNKNQDSTLFSIMNKIAVGVTDNTMRSLISVHRMPENYYGSYLAFIYQHPIGAIITTIVIIGIIATIIILLQRRRRIENLSRDKEIRRLKSMMDQMTESFPMGIFAYTIPRRNILLFNTEAKRLFNYTEDNTDTITGDFVMKNVLDEDRQHVVDTVKGLREVGDEVEYLFRSNTTEGSIAYILCSTRLLAFEDGTKYILSGLRDYTEQVLSNRQLRAEQAQFRDALLKNALYSYSFDVTEGYVTEDVQTQDGRWLLGQGGFTPPCSYDLMCTTYKEQMIIEPASSNFNQCNSCKGLLEMYEEGNTAETYEYYMRKIDRYLSVQVLLSKDVYTDHIIATMINRDITDTRKAEIAQQQLLRDAVSATERANAAKSEFMSHMSHDIRTPMNAILGMATIAGAHLDDKDRVEACLSKINTSSKHLLGLINEVLDMSKIESGKLDLHEEEFDLSNLVDNLMVMTRIQIREKGHRLSVDIGDIQHEKVIGDVERLQQIFMNFLSNAIKYTPQGGEIRIAISEKPSGRRNIGCYETVFEDNGIGISEEFQERIFEPFAREEDSRTSKIQGTGLGMTIANNLVHMFGGNVKVESKINEGSKFTVTFYLRFQDMKEDKNEALIGRSVLVVDDDEKACNNSCALLSEMGIKAEGVHNGKDAVIRVKERQNTTEEYYAVILDWKMDGMDGLQTAREIREQVGANLPLILSAYEWEDIEQEARQAGINAFISRPLFKSRVLNAFDIIMNKDEKVSSTTNIKDFMQAEFKGKRVLLVEDNEFNAEIAEELLKATGLEVDMASNGKEAVDRMTGIEDGYYSVIFMDVQMPVMNGYDAARAIRELPGDYPKRVPIFAMTANAFSEDVQMSRNAGMNEHISKPIDIKVLINVIKKWLAV